MFFVSKHSLSSFEQLSGLLHPGLVSSDDIPTFCPTRLGGILSVNIVICGSFASVRHSHTQKYLATETLTFIDVLNISLEMA
jgi:hypothetical protein